MNNPQCSVVIPNYNGKQMLPVLFQSLAEQKNIKAEWILVDNGSQDNFKEVIPPNVTLVELDKNYGFAYAVNRGIEAAASSYIFLLNNDMTLESEVLTKLVTFLDEHSEYDFVQPKVRFSHAPEHINSVGDSWSVYGLGIQIGFGEEDLGQYDSMHPLFSPTGGAVLFRTSVFTQVGLFDEDFFAYLEDIDLGFRMAHAGLQGVLIPDAVVFHGFGKTSKKLGDLARFLIHRNAVYVLVKNVPFLLILKDILFLMTGQLRMIFIFIKDKKGKLLGKIMMDIFKAYPKLLEKRKKILSNSSISRDELSQLFDRKWPYHHHKTIP